MSHLSKGIQPQDIAAESGDDCDLNIVEHTLLADFNPTNGIDFHFAYPAIGQSAVEAAQIANIGLLFENSQRLVADGAVACAGIQKKFCFPKAINRTGEIKDIATLFIEGNFNRCHAGCADNGKYEKKGDLSYQSVFLLCLVPGSTGDRRTLVCTIAST